MVVAGSEYRSLLLLPSLLYSRLKKYRVLATRNHRRVERTTRQFRVLATRGRVQGTDHRTPTRRIHRMVEESDHRGLPHGSQVAPVQYTRYPGCCRRDYKATDGV